jgi:DNA-binding transcriptional regulator YiaG
MLAATGAWEASQGTGILLTEMYLLIYQGFMFSAKQLQQLRRSTGLSRERFAHLIGVSLASINRWESGASSPSGTTLAIYETINAALARGADMVKIAAASEIRGTPYFLYKLSEAAFGKKEAQS